MKERFHSILNDSKPVLVDFFVEWCGPFKILAPVLKELTPEMRTVVSIIIIDLDKSPALAQQYQGSCIRTLNLIRNGQVIWLQMGLATNILFVDVLRQHV